MNQTLEGWKVEIFYKYIYMHSTWYNFTKRYSLESTHHLTTPTPPPPPHYKLVAARTLNAYDPIFHWKHLFNMERIAWKMRLFILEGEYVIKSHTLFHKYMEYIYNGKGSLWTTIYNVYPGIVQTCICTCGHAGHITLGGWIRAASWDSCQNTRYSDMLSPLANMGRQSFVWKKSHSSLYHLIIKIYLMSLSYRFNSNSSQRLWFACCHSNSL